MQVLKFDFNGNQIEFETGTDLMVNATEMAKIFGKDVPDFMMLKQTKEFIEACLKNQNSGFLGIEKEEDLYISKQKSGTWMHRILALKFAAWLNPEFELWVFITIDNLLNQHFREMKQAMFEKLEAESKKANIKEELLKKYPELNDYFDADKASKLADRKRMAIFKAQMAQYSLSFEKPNE